MKKTDKKIENSIIAALTDVCGLAHDEVVGFKWITHFVNYSNYPNSLVIVCVFDTRDNVSNAFSSNQHIFLHSLINDKLHAAGITIKDVGQRIQLDSEEACNNEHDGKWHERYG